MAVKTKTQQAPNADSINIGISSENRSDIVALLQQLLADEHLLYMKLRNYHWNVVGIHFKELHALFQEHYTQLEPVIDDIAERIRQLGHFAPGSLQEMLQHARLEETGHLDGDATRMLQNLLNDQEMLIQVLRHDVDDTLEKYGDAGTADFLTTLMEMHEKMAWMIRVHLA